MKCYMHVNYLEHILPVSEIMRQCASAGYDGIELRGWDVNNKMSQMEYLESVASEASDHRLDLVFGCRNESFSSDERVRRQSLETLKTILDFSAAHGGRILNVFAGATFAKDVPRSHFEMNGSACAGEEQWRMTVEYFQQAADHAAPLNMDICFETHNGYLHDLAEPTCRLLDRIDRPNAKANFDYGNIHLNRKNRGLINEMNMLAGRIGYAHLKNLVSLNQFESRAFFRTPLDAGDINHFVLLRHLLGGGYRGPLTIENTMPGDKRRWMHHDLAYLKSILADLCGCAGHCGNRNDESDLF